MTTARTAMILGNDELDIVRFALALHLDIEPFEIEEPQHLEDELGLDPLDLVLVVLRLEELGEVEFPVADLEGIHTVGDLVDVVRGWCNDEPTSFRSGGKNGSRAAYDREDRISTLPPPARLESGMHMRHGMRRVMVG